MTADPYVQPIPQWVYLQNDDELRAWYEYDNRWKHDIWAQLGGGSDGIDDVLEKANSNENQIAALYGHIAKLESIIEDFHFEVPIFNPDEIWYPNDINSAHTAIHKEELNCTQGPVITMPTSGRVKVNNKDGAVVTVNLSGSQTIFGESTVLIESKGSVIFKYQVDSDEWVFG